VPSSFRSTVVRVTPNLAAKAGFEMSSKNTVRVEQPEIGTPLNRSV
jgi:hypothetical protein